MIQTSGMVLPQAVGNDVNCGMRLETTELEVDQIRGALDALPARLRRLFFEGGRRIAFDPAQREALLRDGLPGLLASRPDLDAGDVERVHGGGTWPGGTPDAFADWVTSAGGISYDGMIGSVGGGNHFAEVQYVASVSDARAAYAWGLRPGRVVTMVHSGSLALGHAANRIAADLTRSLWPDGLAHPVNGLWPLPLDEASARPGPAGRGAASPGVRPENVLGAAAARRSWTRSCGSSGS